MKTPIEMTIMVGVDISQQDTASLFTLDKKCSSLRNLLQVSVNVLKIKVLIRMSTDSQARLRQQKLLSTIYETLKTNNSIVFQ